MNKSELINCLADVMEIKHNRPVSKADADAFLESLGNVCQRVLATGHELTLPGVGKLSVTQRAERQGRNPQTGEAITIAAKRAPKFTAGKALKDAVSR